MFARIPYGGGASAGDRHAGRDGGRDRHRRGGRLLPGVQRAFGHALREHRRRAWAAALPLWLSWYAPYGLLSPAGWVGLHARRYMETYGVTNEDFGRIAVVDRAHAATNPGGVVLRAADHHRGPSGVALDRRAGAPTPRLLPGERRRGGARRDVGRTRPGPAPAGRRGRGGRAGRVGRRRDDDELLPRRPHRSPRDGRRRRPAVAAVRPPPRRHLDRVPVRPLHAVRAHAARGARVLRPGRGEGLRDRGAAVARRRAADQHERRAPRRGVHPRDERHHRVRAPAPRHRRATRSPTSSTCS